MSHCRHHDTFTVNHSVGCRGPRLLSTYNTPNVVDRKFRKAVISNQKEVRFLIVIPKPKNASQHTSSLMYIVNSARQSRQAEIDAPKRPSSRCFGLKKRRNMYKCSPHTFNWASNYANPTGLALGLWLGLGPPCALAVRWIKGVTLRLPFLPAPFMLLPLILFPFKPCPVPTLTPLC